MKRHEVKGWEVTPVYVVKEERGSKGIPSTGSDGGIVPRPSYRAVL